MSKFKIGDILKLKDPHYQGYGEFASNGKSATVSAIHNDGYTYGFKENGDGHYAHWLDVEDNFKLLKIDNWKKEIE